MGRAGKADIWREPVSEIGQYDSDQDLMHAARCMIVARRALTQAIPVDVIHDPSLDMMLALFMAQDFRLSRCALHAATTVAGAVARRWVDVAIAAGWMEVACDAGGDIRLTTAGAAMLRSALQAVIDSQRVLNSQQLH